MIVSKLGDGRRIRMLQLPRPLRKSRTMMLGQHRPGSEVLQTRALPAAIRIERGLAACSPGHREKNRQSLALGFPGAVSIDRRSRVEIDHELVPTLIDLRPLVVVGERVLGNSLDAEIER